MSDVPPGKNTEHPESVGRYRIIRRLGEGGMGSVFLALDTILHREVALKLPLTGTENDPEVRERFLREARSTATLDHPYICRVYDSNEVDGQPYLAMAYIEGSTLEDLVRSEGMPPKQVVALVGKLAIALQEAHDQGVVHRDLKPRNVMIRSVGKKKEPVIVDFGLARLDKLEDVRLTRTGQVMGTPAYMAPEQLRANPDEIGPACDSYALGVMLSELLTGRLPFNGPYPVMVAQILMQPPLPPSSLRHGLDPRLDAICLKALAKDASDRYGSMLELATALTNFLRDKPAISTPNLPLAPTSRTVERDSIPTGVDSLVEQFFEQEISEAQALPPRLDSIRSRSGSTTRNKFLIPGLVGSFAIGLLVLAALLFWPKDNEEKRSGSDKIGQTNSKRSVQPEVEPTPPTLANDAKATPKLVVGTPPIPPIAAESVVINTLGMKLQLIPVGKFLMGSDNSDPDAADDEKANGKKHSVEISKPFYLDATEVTVGQFRKFIEQSSYRTDAEKDRKGGMGWVENVSTPVQDPKFSWRAVGYRQTDDHPVVNVSWNDAVAFCEWLSRQERHVYRLPSEAEWEYACRADTTTPYWCGADKERMTKIGNVFDGSAKEYKAYWPAAWESALNSKDGYVFTAPVGSFAANSLGLHDMHGNVNEWCSDFYNRDYYSVSPAIDPENKTWGTDRSYRGGGWRSNPPHCRSARRGHNTPDYRHYFQGFRVARELSSSLALKAADQTPITNGIGMNLQLIQAGEFLMGSDSSDPDAGNDEKVNGQKHLVRINNPFYMGTTEVTVGQFRRFVDTNPQFKTSAEKDGYGGYGWNETKKAFELGQRYTWRSPGFPQTEDHPVTNVSWNDAVAFCDWLSQEEGKTYRLPTEAEWEYSCRAGQATRYSSGDNPETLATVGNVADATAREKVPEWSFAINAKDGYIFTAPVRQFQSNAFGLYDMHGNVWEWCLDSYDERFYANSPTVDPQNLTQAADRVTRGGSWSVSPRNCRSASRLRRTPNNRRSLLGFRVVLVR